MKRRAVLSTVAGSLFVTGCVSGLGFGSDPRGVVITRLSIDNFTRSSHAVALEVVSDGDVSKTYAIGPRRGDVLGGQVIRTDLPTEPSETVIRAEMGEESAETNLAEQFEEACLKVMVVIERNASLSVWWSNDGTECFGG